MMVAAPVEIRALAQGVLYALFLYDFYRRHTYVSGFFMQKKERIDNMDGRGANMRVETKKIYSGWNYRGFKDRLEQLENALDSSRSLNTITVVAKASQKLISNIDKELKTPAEQGGNVARLKAFKYRAQKLHEKAKKKYNG